MRHRIADDLDFVERCGAAFDDLPPEIDGSAAVFQCAALHHGAHVGVEIAGIAVERLHFLRGLEPLALIEVGRAIPRTTQSEKSRLAYAKRIEPVELLE